MKLSKPLAAGLTAALFVGSGVLIQSVDLRASGNTSNTVKAPAKTAPPAKLADVLGPDTHPAIAPFVTKGIEWLVEAQNPNGGWGAGSHAKQNVRDPHAVQTDPATTAFAAMALLRAGNTPTSGRFNDSVRRAAEHLATLVNAYAEAGPLITDRTGTQPQAKLGPLIDTSVTMLFFSRLLPTLPEKSELRGQVDLALEKCLRKLQSSQQKNGSWGGGGWASVLQSSFGCSALELAQAAGKNVDTDALKRAREYQKGNFDATTGRASTEAAAGVELYSNSSSQRATAREAREANDAIEKAKTEGKLGADAPVSADNLVVLGLDRKEADRLSSAYTMNNAQIARLNDDAMLNGFGSNGGEEFLSYLLSSESLVMTGGEQFAKWNSKMHERLKKIQSPNGSWTGHHCITSPVFCTAAVVQCLTADRDAELLMKISAKDGDA